MRFMVIGKATADTEAGVPPSAAALEAMSAYNEALVAAGVLVAAGGLRPSADGARVRFSATGRTVIEGPFPATGDLVAGWSILEVASRDEAVEWVRRAPYTGSGGEYEVEIRQLWEAEDFGEALTPELRAAQERRHAAVAEQHG